MNYKTTQLIWRDPYHGINTKTLERIAKALGVTAAELLEDEAEGNNGQRLGRIIDWCDQEIKPGTNWKQEIDTHLNDANVILLLISPSFIASDYCSSVELQRAITRHKTEDIYVLPIILRPVHWGKRS